MTTPLRPPLSPAAQAVLSPFLGATPTPGVQELAAALRAAADYINHDWSGFNCVDALCEIAAELEEKAAMAAEPEPASVVREPSDAELLGLDQLEEAWNAQADEANGWNELGLDEIIAWAQRQALARYGHQPAPPAAGEVGEFITQLKSYAEYGTPIRLIPFVVARAADLLSQRHPTPVPVSERLPGSEDCDGEGRCWLFSKVEKEWRLLDVRNPGVPHLKYCFSHWLPATALPLPAGEVEE